MLRIIIAVCGALFFAFGANFANLDFAFYRDVVAALVAVVLIGPWVVRQFES